MRQVIQVEAILQPNRLGGVQLLQIVQVSGEGGETTIVGSPKSHPPAGTIVTCHLWQLDREKIRQEKLDKLAHDTIATEATKLINEAYRSVFEGTNTKENITTSNIGENILVQDKMLKNIASTMGYVEIQNTLQTNKYDKITTNEGTTQVEVHQNKGTSSSNTKMRWSDINLKGDQEIEVEDEATTIAKQNSKQQYTKDTSIESPSISSQLSSLDPEKTTRIHMRKFMST